VLDVNEIVGSMSVLLRRVLGEDVTLLTELEPALWATEVDPAQFEQVIMNLAVNARDAMPRGGRLSITTANRELDEAFARAHPAVEPGRHVMMSMSDTGHGMDEETRAHVFEPFFTTKALGRGTGLGLSTVYGIVKQSGGTVWVSSALDEGSTFSVYLPAVDAEAAPLVLRPRADATMPAAGAETILVVEDESSVRSLVARILRRQGYKVYEASEASEVLELLTDPPHIDLLLTDVVLPGMGGPELAAVVEQAAPRVKVLFMSGYTRDAAILSGRVGPGVTLLEKPFTPDALARQVREVLDRER
jgi:CheY-like chemotaxis protein